MYNSSNCIQYYMQLTPIYATSKMLNICTPRAFHSSLWHGLELPIGLKWSLSRIWPGFCVRLWFGVPMLLCLMKCHYRSSRLDYYVLTKYILNSFTRHVFVQRNVKWTHIRVVAGKGVENCCDCQFQDKRRCVLNF